MDIILVMAMTIIMLIEILSVGDGMLIAESTNDDGMSNSQIRKNTALVFSIVKHNLDAVPEQVI